MHGTVPMKRKWLKECGEGGLVCVGGERRREKKEWIGVIPIRHGKDFGTKKKQYPAFEQYRTLPLKYIEDIYFFEVNTKYISSNVLKISEISRVRSTNEIADIFNTFDEIYLEFIHLKKVNFLFIFSVREKKITFFLAISR